MLSLKIVIKIRKDNRSKEEVIRQTFNFIKIHTGGGGFMAKRKPVKMKLTVIKESSDAEITERICKAYLREEKVAIGRAVKEGFETLEPVWQKILAPHKEEIENARKTSMAAAQSE